ncbi:hypothetical protein C2G38_2187194 [Gigaspora rosea]|uniref:Uncharacterized protein n=1 Tax=Gigaspora rosea TaxID=44941 RepID=A0A397V6G0_9GLOM|nr:hypothetical protein C2G38_2187194 [Gigaspora rosea]
MTKLEALRPTNKAYKDNTRAAKSLEGSNDDAKSDKTHQQSFNNDTMQAQSEKKKEKAMKEKTTVLISQDSFSAKRNRKTYRKFLQGLRNDPVKSPLPPLPESKPTKEIGISSKKKRTEKKEINKKTTYLTIQQDRLPGSLAKQTSKKHSKDSKDENLSSKTKSQRNNEF